MKPQWSKTIRQLEKLENYYGASRQVPFLHEQFAHLHTGNTLKKSSNIASDENIIKNNYIFVMLWNLSVISHLIFPQSFFFLISGAKSKNNLKGYVAF